MGPELKSLFSHQRPFLPPQVTYPCSHPSERVTTPSRLSVQTLVVPSSSTWRTLHPAWALLPLGGPSLTCWAGRTLGLCSRSWLPRQSDPPMAQWPPLALAEGPLSHRGPGVVFSRLGTLQARASLEVSRERCSQPPSGPWYWGVRPDPLPARQTPPALWTRRALPTSLALGEAGARCRRTSLLATDHR